MKAPKHMLAKATLSWKTPKGPLDELLTLMDNDGKNIGEIILEIKEAKDLIRRLKKTAWTDAPVADVRKLFVKRGYPVCTPKKKMPITKEFIDQSIKDVRYLYSDMLDIGKDSFKESQETIKEAKYSTLIGEMRRKFNKMMQKNREVFYNLLEESKKKFESKLSEKEQAQPQETQKQMEQKSEKTSVKPMLIEDMDMKFEEFIKESNLWFSKMFDESRRIFRELTMRLPAEEKRASIPWKISKTHLNQPERRTQSSYRRRLANRVYHPIRKFKGYNRQDLLDNMTHKFEGMLSNSRSSLEKLLAESRTKFEDFISKADSRPTLSEEFEKMFDELRKEHYSLLDKLYGDSKSLIEEFQF